MDKPLRPISRLRKSGLNRPLAVATISAAAIATSHALIIYSGEVNITPQVNQPTAINVDSQGGSEFSLSNFSGKGSFSFSLSTFSTDFDYVAPTSNASILSKLSSSVPISSSSTFTTSANASIGSENGGQWANGASGYFGFQFNPTASLTLYGWGQLTVSANGQAVTLVDYAYEDTGASISTAAIPEPSAYLLVGLCLAIICYRRNRSHRDVVA